MEELDHLINELRDQISDLTATLLVACEATKGNWLGEELILAYRHMQYASFRMQEACRLKEEVRKDVTT